MTLPHSRHPPIQLPSLPMIPLSCDIVSINIFHSPFLLRQTTKFRQLIDDLHKVGNLIIESACLHASCTSHCLAIGATAISMLSGHHLGAGPIQILKYSMCLLQNFKRKIKFN